MHKRKINETTVKEWYTTYRDMVYTYLTYLTFSPTVDSLVSQVIIQSVKISASRRTSHIHPHTLVLSTARFSARKKYRHKTPQRLLESLSTSESVTEDVLKWIKAVLSLPGKEREVFVLREILGLDSRQTSQIVKNTSIKVEARLVQAVEWMHDSLHSEYTKQMLRKLKSDTDSLYEAVLPTHVQNLLRLSIPNEDSQESIVLESYHQWLRARRRRRMLTAGSSATTVIVLGAVAMWMYKPWVYFLKPAMPVAKTQHLQHEYTTSLGFIPRLPSSLPKGFHLFTTSLQRGDGPDQRNERLFSIVYLTGKNTQQSRISIVEGGQQVQHFSGLNESIKPTTITVNSVQVHIVADAQNPSTMAHFNINGAYYSILSNGPPKDPVTKEQMLQLIRSMIVHPKVIAHTTDYTYDSLNSLQEIQAKLNFTPVFLNALPNVITSGSTQAHGFVVTHQSRKYGTFNIDYASTNRTVTLNILESKGSVTGPTGQPEGVQFQPQPGQKYIIVLGQKVYTQQYRMIWKSKRTGVSFQVNIQGSPTSITQSKIDLKQIVRQLIKEEQSVTSN